MTLQDALDAKFVEILSVQKSLEAVPISDLPGLENEDLYPKQSTSRRRAKSPTLLSDVQLKQLVLKNVKGEFSIVVYNNEKCVFKDYCESPNCLLKSTRWSIQTLPFSCGIPNKLGDYKEVIYP